VKRRAYNRVHPDDKNQRRRTAICAAFSHGKSAGEIAAEFRVTRETVVGIVARAGLSRGDKPAPPRRFSWETPDRLTFTPEAE